MINLIGLIIHLREMFPIPEQWGAIYHEMTKQLGEEPNDETQRDAYTALVRLWHRDGWMFDNDIGAVKLNEGEEATFDNDAITIASGKNGSTMVVSVARGEHHARILWF
jgi:hypothetical protein